MMSTLTLKIKVVWWVKPYLTCVAWCAYATGREPDIDKIKGVVLRGVKAIT